jgi:diguanylate cyclase (GGDEF)-like protein
MTLRAQLSGILALLFLLVFAGVSVVSVEGARRYLAEQLASHAQDTATSLGLSLSQPMKQGDLPTMTSMVDAIFDRGYYREITVRSIQGKTLISRVLPVKVEGVPAWFVRLIPIETPKEEALVMSGWRQAAIVEVAGHPGYAYQQLWRNSMGELAWLGMLAAATLILGGGAMHFVLKSLKAVENQADAIGARNYVIQDRLPWTKDLRRVVEVMNRMSAKVRDDFEAQQMLADMLRAEAYLDPVTRIGNRRHFDVQIANLVSSTEEFYNGALFLIALDGLAHYNQNAGFEAGNALLRSIAQGLRSMSEGMRGSVLARLSGSNFALVVQDVGLVEAEHIADRMSERLASLCGDNLSMQLGLALFVKGMSVSTLMAEADMALRAARRNGAWVRFEGKASVARGAEFWRSILEKTSEEGKILIHVQKVIDGESLIHCEALIRMEHEGEILNAGLFMPMAESLGYAGKLDRLVIDQVLAMLPMYPKQKFAINLSIMTLNEHDFPAWLEGRLKRAGKSAGRLDFEMSEFDVSKHQPEIAKIIERLKPYGCGFGVDRCGRGFASFSYLASLKIDYLKIDGSYVRNIDRDKGNQFLVQAIAGIAHGVGVRVYAESVEMAAERTMLDKLHVDGFQGFLIGKPSPLA